MHNLSLSWRVLNVMRHFYLVSFLLIFICACHKETGGPRKLKAIGYIEYSFSTNLITTVHYDKKDDRVFTMRINKDQSLGGDVKGKWSPSGAQMTFEIDGSFGPNSPFPIDYGYYESKDFIVIEGHEVNMRDFADKTYFVMVTKGSSGNNLYYRDFVFE